MTRAERSTVKRVVRAFDVAMERLGVRYSLEIEIGRPDHFVPGSLLAISRTGRELDDSSAFTVTLNPGELGHRTAAELAVDCGHELLHALLMEHQEAASRCPTWSSEKHESVVYQLQRAIFGEAA